MKFQSGISTFLEFFETKIKLLEYSVFVKAFFDIYLNHLFFVVFKIVHTTKVQYCQRLNILYNLLNNLNLKDKKIFSFKCIQTQKENNLPNNVSISWNSSVFNLKNNFREIQDIIPLLMKKKMTLTVLINQQFYSCNDDLRVKCPPLYILR